VTRLFFFHLQKANTEALSYGSRKVINEKSLSTYMTHDDYCTKSRRQE